MRSTWYELLRLFVILLLRFSDLQIGLEVLKVAPKDRCDNMLETLKIMTMNNKFFNERKEQYGELTYNQMLKCIYLE